MGQAGKKFSLLPIADLYIELIKQTPMKVTYRLLCLSVFAGLFSCTSSEKPTFEDTDYSDFKFYHLAMGKNVVGFHSELHWDENRAFNNLDKRPLLIGMWYPANVSQASRQLYYKEYLLANMEHDGLSNGDTTMNWLRQGFIQSAKDNYGMAEADALRLMDLPVRAFDNTTIKPGKHPLLLYAASFNAGIHENAAIFEYLASHGYVVASIASVGHNQPAMSADSMGIAAQLADFELLFEKTVNRPYIDSEKVATSGFSWGGFSATLLGIEKEADLMISMDGSQTYFQDALRQYQSTYTRPANGAYVQLSQRMFPNAQFTQDTMAYHWIGQSADAYYYRFKTMDHRDFGGNFQFLQALANDSIFQSTQSQRHSEIYSKDEKGEAYLKTAEMMLQSLNAYLLNKAKDKAALLAQPDSLFTIIQRHLHD